MYEELVDAMRCAYAYVAKAGENPYRFVAYYKQAADAIENMSEAYDKLSRHMDDLAALMPRWIPVTERLPEDRQSVLVHRDDGGIFIFEYFTTSPTDECWIDDHLNVYSAYSVTHWMPLPEPPKEET